MYERLIKTISEHISISTEDAEFLASLFTPKTLRRRQHLVQAGDVCRYECFVNKGCLRQFYTDESGQEHTLMFAIEDWWISDMYSLVMEKPSITNVDDIRYSLLYCSIFKIRRFRISNKE